MIQSLRCGFGIACEVSNFLFCVASEHCFRPGTTTFIPTSLNTGPSCTPLLTCSPPCRGGGGDCGPNRFLGLCVCVGIGISVFVISYLLAVYYLVAVYLCYSSVKISVSVLCYLCVYIGLRDAALTTIRALKKLLLL